MRPTSRPAGGFALLGVMTVVAIMGILAALAISFMPRFIRRAGLRSSTFDLIAAIEQAKTRSAQS